MTMPLAKPRPWEGVEIEDRGETGRREALKSRGRKRVGEPSPPRLIPHSEGAGEISDNEVIRRCLAGEKDLFRYLMERYEKRAFWVAFNLLGNTEEARDVLQDAFVRAYRSLDRFDFGRKFYTWFFRIVTNLAIDRLRRRGVAKSVSLGEELEETLPSGESPSLPLEREETRRKVRELLETLPPKFKAVMVLRDIEGLSCKEIAPVLGTTYATVRWRLHKARQIFREKWERMARNEEQAK